MLVWLDLETTGLDPQKEHVLEVAAIVTDDSLHETAPRFERVIYSKYAAEVLPRCHELQGLLGTDNIESTPLDVWRSTGCRLDPFVIKMHWENGLWEKVRHGQALATVDADFADYIRTYAVTADENGKSVLPQLAGSTISFDRGFLATHLPKTLDTLHYRNVDVSTFNETAKRFWPPLYEARPGRGGTKAHRGMVDIELSIEVYKHYLGALSPCGPAMYAKPEAA